MQPSVEQYQQKHQVFRCSWAKRGCVSVSLCMSAETRRKTSAGATCSWQSKQYYGYFAIPKIQEYGTWYFVRIPDSHMPIAMTLDKLQGQITADNLVGWCQPSNKRRRSCPLFLKLLNIVVLWLMGWSQVRQLISRITVECLRYFSEPCSSTLDWECVHSFPTVKLLFRS